VGKRREQAFKKKKEKNKKVDGGPVPKMLGGKKREPSSIGGCSRAAMRGGRGSGDCESFSTHIGQRLTT